MNNALVADAPHRVSACDPPSRVQGRNPGSC
jgi:hypothetical protein